jgi:hypothetical protein
MATLIAVSSRIAVRHNLWIEAAADAVIFQVRIPAGTIKNSQELGFSLQVSRRQVVNQDDIEALMHKFIATIDHNCRA